MKQIFPFVMGSLATDTNQPYTLEDVFAVVQSHQGSADTLMESVIRKMMDGLHMETIRARLSGSLPKSNGLKSISEPLQHECGICGENIARGTRGKGSSSVAATNMCDHYFCHDCLGDYLEQKITDAEVKNDQLVCPYEGCEVSMLLGPLGNYEPMYLFTSENGTANGLLGSAFDFDKAKELNDKFLEHRFRLEKRKSGMIQCPNLKCNIPIELPSNGQQFFRCVPPGCGQSFCRKCWRPAHNDIKDCDAAMQNSEADAALAEMLVKLLAEGGRYCPKCGTPSAAENPDPYHSDCRCDHMTCGACKYEFCRQCGADRVLIKAEDLSYHVSKCGLYVTYDDAKPDEKRPTDWPLQWRTKDPQFNGQGETLFDEYPAYKEQWKALGVLPSPNGKIKGYFRKCQPDCGCAYGSGHSTWTEHNGN